MTFIDKLYCGKLPKSTTLPAGSSETQRLVANASFDGCLYAAEQVPLKAGLFAFGAFVLGAAVMHFSMKARRV